MLFAVSALIMTVSSAALKWVYGQANGYESIKREAVKGPMKMTSSKRS